MIGEKQNHPTVLLGKQPGGFLNYLPMRSPGLPPRHPRSSAPLDSIRRLIQRLVICRATP